MYSKAFLRTAPCYISYTCNFDTQTVEVYMSRMNPWGAYHTKKYTIRKGSTSYHCLGILLSQNTPIQNFIGPRVWKFQRAKLYYQMSLGV